MRHPAICCSGQAAGAQQGRSCRLGMQKLEEAGSHETGMGVVHMHDCGRVWFAR